MIMQRLGRSGRTTAILTIAFGLGTVSSAAAQVSPMTPPPASGRPVTFDSILSADVLARVYLIRDEVELIRFEMGRPKATLSDLRVTNASPREVMFQAFTLYLKANDLRFEITGAPGLQLQLEMPRKVRPLHVWRVLDIAYERLLEVRRELDISERPSETPQPATSTPTDVFRAIAGVNRNLDLLVSERLAPEDVFYQVKLASNYAIRLLERFPGAPLIPPAPRFERGKRPVDVFNLLVQSYELLHEIARRSGIETLSLEVTGFETKPAPGDEIAPSGVYNMAILVVSELAYLHAQLNYSDTPIPAREPGVKVSSHVYQQARILQLQLEELRRQVEQRADWLGDQDYN
ncbi:MAG: hypothetical protein ACE5HT_07210 [Gemmatimonadales bacterium]